MSLRGVYTFLRELAAALYGGSLPHILVIEAGENCSVVPSQCSYSHLGILPNRQNFLRRLASSY